MRATEGFAINRVNIFNNTIANSTFKSDNAKIEGAFRVLVYDRPEQGKIGSQISNITLVNNIVANIDGDYAISVRSDKPDGIVNLVSDFNVIEKEVAPLVYWKPNGGTAISYQDLATYATATGQDGHSYAGDPAFVDSLVSDFHLTAGSFAINAGTVADRSSDHDGMPIDNAPDISAYEFQYADLIVEISDNPDPALTDSPLTYTLTATNAGPSAAINVVVTHTLPAGVTGSGVPSQGSCTGTTVINCNLGTLSNAQSATVTVTATPGAEALFDATPSETFSVNVSASAMVTAAEADPIPANNAATVTTNVRLACLGKAVTKHGASGNDGTKDSRFAGGSSADVIHTLSGDDWIAGNGGNDTICGGAGNDNLRGNGGADTLSGGSWTQ